MHIPKINSLKLEGFSPLFDKVNIDFQEGFYLILGGNGLGKTTILQSLIYGLAGSFDKEVDKDTNKSFLWNQNYFKGRINNYDSATVEVNFCLNNRSITVKRGFKSSSILALKIDTEDWIDNPSKCNKVYEDIIEEFGSYKNYADFRYIMHKLVYLPEIRPNIAWDMDAQTRILMTICSDIYDEESFRNKRDLLKKTDSKKRHIHVAITNAKESIEKLAEYNVDNSEEVDESESEYTENRPEPSVDIEKISDELRSITEIKQMHMQKMGELRRKLSDTSDEVELLQERINSTEASLIIENLKNLEGTESQLALFKLISLGLCPACGSKATELQARAKRMVSQHSCPLCGAKDDLYSLEELETSYSKLSMKLREKASLEIDINDLQEQINGELAKYETLQFEYDRYKLSQSAYQLIEYKIPAFTKDQLENALTELKKKHEEYEISCIEIQKQIEDDLTSFQQKAASRINRLKELYSYYASAFLSTKCDLVPYNLQTKDSLLSLTLYVPKFNNYLRENEKECSEAQRFFLDIAFRMAIIHLSGEIHGSYGTFVCETPENALDMSYIDNVADMFINFAKEKFSIILTSNIQLGSLAKPLLSSVPYDIRNRHLINLLEFGNLSEIQGRKLPELKNVVKDIIGGIND